MARAPPTIDFTAAISGDSNGLKKLAIDIRHACINFGFFQLVNHGVSEDLQRGINDQAREFFSLPIDIKEKYDKDQGGFHRGYERLRSQNFEKLTEGDLKEGFYFGKDLPLDNPNETVDKYHEALTELAKKILRVLAMSLDIEPGWFSEFAENPIATLRLLHYPPQPVDASALERGIGAHTDFGAITILLQDMVGGLQIWDRETSQWVDVVPVESAYVVNLGNLMMRWTNDKYLSNLHRVINKSGKQRYSIPFFFSGNPDFKVECLPSCIDQNSGAKYPPITVHDWMTGRYADTYGTGDGAMGELAAKDVAASLVGVSGS